MLATLIIWTYILIFSYIYGWTIVESICKLFRINTEIETFSKPLIILAGICGINTFAAFLSLFIKLGWVAQAIFLLLGLILGLRMWKKRVCLLSGKLAPIPWWIWTLALLAFLTVLENGTHAPANSDTGIYHAQAIRWMETYPAVPGLGNLHHRFAYNSNWLVVNAFFSFSFLGIRSFHVLPGAFLLVVLTYFMGGVFKLFKREITISNVIKTLLIPLIFYILGSEISSPGTDFPATIWIWVTFSLFLEIIETKVEPQQNTIRLEEILVFIFSVYLITVKLSTVPLLLLSAVLLLKHIRKNFNAIIKLTMLALMILAPWFARNLILSGYWIYPAPLLSIFSPNWDWKIPLKSVVNKQNGILAWARIPGANPDDVLAMPFISWLKEWFQNLTLNQRFLVSGAVFSPVIYVIASLVVLRKLPLSRYFGFTFLASYCGLAFWLLGAPAIRFGYGFIVITILLAVSPLVKWFLDRTPNQKFIVVLLVSLIILYQASVLYGSINFRNINERILLPADYGSLATRPCDIHGYTLFCAEYYNQCWYNPFPCIPPGSANSHVEMREETFRSGFRVINGP